MRDSVEAGGRTRTYEIVGAADGRPGRDLVLVFHGSKQTGAVHRKFTGGAFDARAERGDAVIVYLDGYRGNWNDARRQSSFPARVEKIDDVAFTRAVVGRVTASHGTGRVLAVGYSNGGQMVMRLAHEAPELIAGAAVLGATMPAPENFAVAGPAGGGRLPVLVMHGTKDPIVAYQGGEMRWWARKVFKVGGRSLSAPETAAYFARRNGITVTPVSTTLPGTTVERTEHRQEGRHPVILVTVHGGGHTIPGPRRAPFVLGATNRDVSAADLIAEFFDSARAGTEGIKERSAGNPAEAR